MKYASVLACALCSTAAIAADEAAIKQGHEVFQYWCAACHGRGEGPPGTTALAALYQGAKPALLEDRTDLTPELIKLYVRNGVSVMPFFRKTEISDAELDALSVYLSRNLKR
jgi:mono/diheme cytochrome c family protein